MAGPAADLAYRAAGVRVPDCRIYRAKDGGVVKLSQFIDGGTPLGEYMRTATPGQRDAVVGQLREGYLADALAANWDVLGTGQDNVLVDRQGRAWRVDNGSAFGFRAQGARKKPGEFEERVFPEDWRSLRESRINRGVYDKLSACDVFSSDLDLDAFAAGLPEKTRRALAGPLAELKEMQTRCHGAMKAGYTPGAVSQYLEYSWQLSRGGFREECPEHVAHGDFGFCRKQRGRPPAASGRVSLTDHLYRQAKAVPMVDEDGRPVYGADGKQKTESLDVARIAGFFHEQGDSSWAVDACKTKVAELAARGKNWDPPPYEEDVYYGVGNALKWYGYDNARKHYLAHPDELAPDVKALNMWRAATGLMLENSDFDGNCREGRYVMIGRTDAPRFFSSKPGTVGDAFKMGPAESYSAFNSVMVQEPGVGVRLVPYERIHASYFFDSSPRGGQLFAADREKEFGIDGTGLPVYYAGPLGSRFNYKEHEAEIMAAFKEYYDARPDLERPYGT